MSMTLYPLGVGDAFAGKHYSTALALEAEGRWLLIDCPHPIRKMMLESAAPIDVGHLDGVVLTHLHGDHVSGLEGLAFFDHFLLRRRTVLATHPRVAADLWDRHYAATMADIIAADGTRQPPRGFEDYFDHRPLTPKAPLQIGPFTIECRPTRHHIYTTAVRVTAGGVTLAYSADTAYDPALIDWLDAADRIVHEVNYGGAHTPYEKLVALPQRLQDKMWLVQYSDLFDPDASTIEALREGRVYPVEPAAAG